VGGAASTVTYQFGVVPPEAPKAFRWGYSYDNGHASNTARPFLLVNATTFTRIYQNEGPIAGGRYHKIVLSGESLCYVDNKSIDGADPDSTYYALAKEKGSHFNGFQDITNPNEPIYNGVMLTNERMLTTCANFGSDDCSSGKWGSISIGVANIGSSNLGGAGGIKPAEILLLDDTGWENHKNIYWDLDYYTDHSALMQIQGTIDGRHFDVVQAAPNLMQIKSAPPCSNNLVE
jgi:hypothetical protein